MFVFPMAGLSRRFRDAGFEAPKYMLPAHGRTLFEHAVLSFERYFDSEPFLFVYRDVHGTDAFVRRASSALGVRDCAFVPLQEPTRGQAETVAAGLRALDHAAGGPVTIFNIDTFRPGFEFPPVADADGYLEVFRGSGANWSYVRPGAPGSTRVVETAEKRPISDLCCTGLYHFRDAGAFLAAFDEAAARPAAERQGGELYVAPLYNQLIRAGADIRYHLIEESAVIFCGVPAEYAAFLAQTPPLADIDRSIP